MLPTRRGGPLALGLALILVACQPSSSASPPGGSPAGLRPVTLLLGFRPDVQFAAFYLAEQDGFFADVGLEVTIEHRGESDLIRLVADGQAQLGVADATDVIIGRSTGIPIRYVGTLYDHFPVALIGSPEVVPDDPAGLAGLRIGTPGRYGSSWAALLAMLAAGGLTEDDVTIREYPAFNQVEGLLNGDVDLITGFRTNEPLQLEARGKEVELMTVDEVAPLPGPGIVVGDELLSVDSQLAADVVDAVIRAEQAIAADPERGLDAAIREVPTVGEDRETARAVLEATVQLWGGNAQAISGAIDLDVWRKGYRTMVELGLVDGSVPVEEMYRSLAGSG